MKRFVAWAAFIGGCLYFLLPLVGMTEFSLKMRRGEYSFDAYGKVLADPRFQETFTYSVTMALVTILFGVFLVVPTAYWVRLKLPRLRPYIEFVTLLPLVIPAIVIVFGYIRLYNTSSWLPLTGSAFGTDILLMFGYATLALPYMYRAVDTGLRTIDVGTLTEAAQSLGAGWVTILGRIILPNVMIAVLSGAFLTFAIVIVAVARWRGLRAMVGIIVAFGVLVVFLLPALRDGAPAVPVALSTRSEAPSLARSASGVDFMLLPRSFWLGFSILARPDALKRWSLSRSFSFSSATSALSTVTGGRSLIWAPPCSAIRTCATRRAIRANFIRRAR